MLILLDQRCSKILCELGFIDDDPVMSSPYPMLVNNLTDAENMQLNNLAARHSAKIVQRAEDVCQGKPK